VDRRRPTRARAQRGHRLAAGRGRLALTPPAGRTARSSASFAME
jgi:hypothetical protein